MITVGVNTHHQEQPDLDGPVRSATAAFGNHLLQLFSVLFLCAIYFTDRKSQLASDDKRLTAYARKVADAAKAAHDSATGSDVESASARQLKGALPAFLLDCDCPFLVYLMLRSVCRCVCVC